MLQAISWQQYFTAIITITAGWYLYVWVRFFRPALSPSFHKETGKSALTPAVRSTNTAQIMGAARPDEATYVAEADALLFASTTPDEVSEQTVPKGPSDDLLEEGQILVDASADTSKEIFFTMLDTLLDKYQVHEEEIQLFEVLPALSRYAEGKLPFSYTADEWPVKWPNR